MAFAAVDKQGRSRCDSPAPRSCGASLIPDRLECQHGAREPAPPIFIAALLAAGLGYVKMLIDAKKPFVDSPTWVAMFVFLGIGLVVMRFDVHDIAMQDAQKDGTHCMPTKQRSNANGTWLLLVSSFLALFLGVMLACLTEVPLGLLRQIPIASHQPVQVASSSKLVSQQMAVDLLSRSTRATKNDIENTYGRYLDASLNIWSDHSAASRCARDELAVVSVREAATCIASTTASRWRTSVQWSEEVATFLLSVVLLLGVAASRSDLYQMIQEQQEHAGDEDFGADEYPPAEKCSKVCQVRSEWRFYACVVLLLAVVASAVAAFVEEM